MIGILPLLTIDNNNFLNEEKEKAFKEDNIKKELLIDSQSNFNSYLLNKLSLNDVLINKDKLVLYQLPKQERLTLLPYKDQQTKGGQIFSGDIHKGCYNSYCWESETEFFKKAEEYFLKDLYEGKHNSAPTNDNQCNKYKISTIAYGFSIIEQGGRNSLLVRKTNNLFSLKESSNKKYQYIWKKSDGKHNRYLKFDNIFLSTIEFMHNYKYGFGCIINENWVLHYKMGSNAEKDSNFYRYYENLLKYMNFFEKKVEELEKKDTENNTGIFEI